MSSTDDASPAGPDTEAGAAEELDEELDRDEELDEEFDGDEPPRRSGQRAVVFAAAALAFLLIGAAVGMLITNATIERPAVPGEGSVDVGFAQDMSVHHTQAVTMATVELDRTTDKAVANLAFDIQTSQTNQVGQMQGFLSLWNQPINNSGRYMTWMPMTAAMPGMTGMAMPATDGVTSMPGMASPDELKKLRSLSGNELDVFFLQLMLRHHQGGLPMAQYARDHASTDAVRTLARSMIATQQAEVTTMTEMLAERGAKPLPAP